MDKLATIKDDDKPDGYVFGRPTSYRPEFAKIAGRLAKKGATDSEISKIIGVDAVTIWRWRNDFPDFCKAFKAAKAVADERVVRSLYQRAVGAVVETFTTDDQGRAVSKSEHLAPDTAAAFIWLKNRRPAEWRDRREIDISGYVDVSIAIDLTPPAGQVAGAAAKVIEGVAAAVVDEDSDGSS